MLNKFILLGRYHGCNGLSITVNLPQETETSATVARQVHIRVTENMMDNIQSHVKQNDIIAFKGTIEDGNTLVATKVTFLSQNNRKEETLNE